MNMEMKVGRCATENEGEGRHAIDHDAPIGLPGESAEAALEDEAGGADEVHSKGGLKEALVRFLASFEKPKAATDGDEHRDEDSSAAARAQVIEGPSEGEGLGSTEDGAEQAGKKKRDRQVLFAGLSALAVVAVAATGVLFWPSAQKRMVVAEPGMTHTTVLAPAASLASVPKPEIQTPTPQARMKGGDPMQELLALKPADPVDTLKKQAEKIEPAPQAPTRTVAAPATEMPKADDQAAKITPPPADSGPAKPDAEMAAAIAEAGKRPDTPAAAGKPAQDAFVKEAVAVAKDLAPASAKDADRLETMRKETGMLERMTQMAALITHLNGQVNRLESDLAKLAATTEERSADLQRRMALAETNRQMDAATRAQDLRRAETLPVVATKDPKAPVVIKTGPAAAAAAPAETAGEKRAYHIQAASPSLAMLGTGGNDAPMEVVPGSTIPGWGRVAKIEQRGQSWVVVTSGGVIK